MGLSFTSLTLFRWAWDPSVTPSPPVLHTGPSPYVPPLLGFSWAHPFFRMNPRGPVLTPHYLDLLSVVPFFFSPRAWNTSRDKVRVSKQEGRQVGRQAVSKQRQENRPVTGSSKFFGVKRSAFWSDWLSRQL